MNFAKSNGFVKITNLNINTILGLLKLKTEKVVEVSMDGIPETVTIEPIINDMDELWNDYLQHGVLSISISVGEFKRFEELIVLIPKMSEKVIRSCKTLDFYNNIFIVEYEPFPNGGSNKLYYFEDNDTFMFFDENGPNIKIDTKSSSFLDLVS